MPFLEGSKRGFVELRKVEAGYRLFRDGKPYFVKGAGGFDHVDKLAECGGNSIRTWGWEQTIKVLPEARRLGITVCAGLWLEPPRKGFDYSDENAVDKQFTELRRQVDALKDEDSLLIWGVGNELDLRNEDPKVWDSVERLAAYIKKVDMFHPVMTVLASLKKDALQRIELDCPSVDIVGVNSYGDIARVRPTLREMGWTKPYLVTEWGSDGWWEVERTDWGAEIEPTSSQKAQQIRERFSLLRGADEKFLGSYAFLWGSKQETTPTWFSLFDQQGGSYEMVEALEALWKGVPETMRTPRVFNLRLNERLPNESVRLSRLDSVVATAEVASPEIDRMECRWVLTIESDIKREGGDAEAPSKEYVFDYDEIKAGGIRFAAPNRSGMYRLFLYVEGPENTVASANFPFLVE